TGVLSVHAGKPDAAGREAAGLRQGGVVQRAHHPGASGTCGAGEPAGADPGDRAGMAADRRPVAAADRLRPGAGAGAPPGPAGVARPGAAAAGEMAVIRGRRACGADTHLGAGTAGAYSPGLRRVPCRTGGPGPGARPPPGETGTAI